MSTDNASGAGMETVARVRSVAAGPEGVRITWRGPFAVLGEDLVRRTDATCLLAESQAHNAKLEAQVERLREALSNARSQITTFGGTPDPADKFADQIQVALLRQIDAALKP